MELEVGMYFRTKAGTINKIDSFTEDKSEFYFNTKPIFSDEECLGSNWGYTKDIVKASYNIIDILEEGDYANGYYVSKIWEKDEITHYVNETPIKRKEREIVIQAPSYGGIEILKNKNIKSVITHEQMERMAYKVGE